MRNENKSEAEKSIPVTKKEGEIPVPVKAVRSLFLAPKSVYCLFVHTLNKLYMLAGSSRQRIREAN